MPVLHDYRAAAPEEFWDSFPVNNEMSGKSLVSPSRLRGLAMALGVSDPAALEKVCSNLEGGGRRSGVWENSGTHQSAQMRHPLLSFQWR